MQVVRITDLPKGNAEHATPLGLDALAGALRSAVLPGQSVTVSEREVGVGDCSFCVAAMHRALKAAAHVSTPFPLVSTGAGAAAGAGAGAGAGAEGSEEGGPGMEVIENKHSTDVESTKNRNRAVCLGEGKCSYDGLVVSYVLISIQVHVLNDPPGRRGADGEQQDARVPGRDRAALLAPRVPRAH